MKSCPKCKSSEYNNRFFILYINDCGHSLCKNCVENLFVRNSGPCPTCGKLLKKNQFWEQTFDDPMIEKELYYRKKFKKIYNLQEDDFPDQRSYNDYLERFETIVYNVAHDINVDEMRAEVTKFAEANAEAIHRNKNRKSKDEIWLQTQLNEEQQMHERTRLYNEQLAAENQTEQSAGSTGESRALIEELKTSDLPAELIVDAKRKRHVEAELAEKEQQKRMKMKGGINLIGRRHMAAASEAATNLFSNSTAYVYEPPVALVKYGPDLPTPDLIFEQGYLSNVREASVQQQAGGYHHFMAVMRCLTESHDALWMALD